MGRWSRAELDAAHEAYRAAAAQAGATGDWTVWSDMFTEDARYFEHMYGTFEGRAAIHEWITKTMSEWPFTEMKEFPHDWCVCDEERGWWICQIENRFADPGDGEVYQAANLTVLHYAGDGKFSYEEDVYNPAHFGPMVQGWLAAKRAHGETPAGT